MKPWELLGTARTPDGTEMALTRRDTEYVILAGGKSLMSSRMHGSEEALAACALAAPRGSEPRQILVGGLGMGFTLRAALDLLGPDDRVLVAELIPEVIEWNRGVLGVLADHPLRDARATVQVGDVADVLRAGPDRFDAVLLDVDNGPSAFTAPANSRLYGDHGLAAAHRALRPDGVLAVWSAWEDRRFEQRLRYARFKVTVERRRARLKRGGPRHVIFLGRKVTQVI